jgi:hypothetical protein
MGAMIQASAVAANLGATEQLLLCHPERRENLPLTSSMGAESKAPENASSANAASSRSHDTAGFPHAADVDLACFGVDGTDENSPIRPSTNVGCVRTASRKPV